MACFNKTLYVYTSLVTSAPASGTEALSSYSYFVQQSGEDVGIRNRTLTLGRYNTYSISLSSPWTAGTLYPFKISTTADGTHNGGTEYTGGVQGTGSSPGEMIRFTPAHTTPATLYYYSGAVAGMGGTITVSYTHLTLPTIYSV